MMYLRCKTVALKSNSNRSITFMKSAIFTNKSPMHDRADQSVPETLLFTTKACETNDIPAIRISRSLSSVIESWRIISMLFEKIYTTNRVSNDIHREILQLTETTSV